MAHTYGTSARLPATATATTANPATVSLTCGAGTTVLWLGIVVSTTTARTGGAPTYNGIEMTQAGSDRNAGGTPESHVEQWYLLDPPTGASYTISVPNDNTRALTFSAATGLAGSGKWSALDAQSGASGSSTNPAASVTSTRNGDIIFAVCGDGANTWAPTARSGTQINDWDAGTRGHGTQYVLQASAGSQATNWTFGTSEDWAISNAAFRLVSGLKDSGTLIGRAALQEPTIISGTRADVAVGTLVAKAVQREVIIGFDTVVEASLMQAVAEFFGSHTATSVGIDLSQHIPLYVKTAQHEPTVVAFLTPQIPQDVLVGRAAIQAPVIVSARDSKPSADLLTGVAEQHAPAIYFDKRTTVDALAATGDLKATGVSGVTPVTVVADVLIGRSVLHEIAPAQNVNEVTAADHLIGVAVHHGEHIDTANGITLAQHLPLYAKSVIRAPTVDVTIAATNRIVEADSLSGVASVYGTEVSAVPGIMVDCLSGVAELYGTHTETRNSITLEQRLPMSAKASWLQHDIQVNTEYSQPVNVNPDGPLAGVAGLFGNHTSSDLTMTPLTPHEAEVEQFEPIVAGVVNPIDDVTVLPATQIARAALNTPSIQTRSYVYPATFEAVAVQQTPVMEFGINVYPAADHLAGVAEQFEPAKAGSVNVLAERLAGKAVQPAPTERYEVVTVIGLLEVAAVQPVPGSSAGTQIAADCTAAVAEQFDPAIYPVKNVTVTPNRLVITANQKTATLLTVLEGAVQVDCLIATGGMRTPAIYDVHISGLLKVTFAGSTPNIVYTGTKPNIAFTGAVPDAALVGAKE